MSPSRLIVVFVFLPAILAALPKGWEACSRSAADYEQCLIKEASTAINSLINGDKKLSVLPLDPMRITHLEIPKGNGPVSVNLEFNNFDLIGAKQLKIINASNNWEKLEASVYIPKMEAVGDYKVDGKVLVLPIVGSGPFKLDFLDMVLHLVIDFSKNTKNGKTYLHADRFHVDVYPKHLDIRLENLFNGDKALGDNMNVFLNENWEQILNELKPGLQTGLSVAFASVTNNVLSRIPADEIDLP